MTYEEVVKKAKQASKKIDGSAVKEHIAVQIDIEGEGEGAFYIEAADGKISVEPYEYYENDCKIKSDADTVIAVLSGKINAEEAMGDGRIQVEGDGSKVSALVNAVKKAPAKKPAAKKTVATKTPAKKAPAKKAPVKKAPAKK